MDVMDVIVTFAMWSLVLFALYAVAESLQCVCNCSPRFDCGCVTGDMGLSVYLYVLYLFSLFMFPAKEDFITPTLHLELEGEK